MEILGALAAVGTSLLFSVGSLSFTVAGRAIGSPALNRLRLLLAMSVIMLLHTLLYGKPFPTEAEPFRLGYLALSGFVGLVLGDAFLFQGFVLVGPRLSTLMMALAPVMTTLLAWVFLGETLTPIELLGISVTIGGILWVVTDQRASVASSQSAAGSRNYWIGIGCAFLGAVGQAGGLILSKQGLTGDFPALSGNVIRLTTAAVSIWAITFVMGQGLGSFRRLRERPDMFKFILLGTLCGPVFAVTLGLFSVQHIPAGVAATLQSLMPIFLIPLTYFIYQEVPTRRSIVGTGIALIGTGILFL